MKIPVLFEPVFRANSIWYRQFRDGMDSAAARKKYSICEIFSDEDRRGMDLLVLVGTHADWLAQELRRAQTEKIPVLLSGCIPVDHPAVRGAVLMDYAGGMRRLLRYLHGCGKQRPMLYGCLPSSTTDRYKREIFLGEVKALSMEPMVIDNEKGLEDCYRQFREVASEADCAVCVNDIAVSSLMERLQGDGISVPQDLFVTAFGCTETGRLISPSVTTVALDYAAMGREIVSMYAYLFRNETQANWTVKVNCPLEIAESTALMLEVPEEAGAFSMACGGHDFYEDPEVNRLMSLESLLIHLDACDRSILAALLKNIPYEAIAEQLEMPVNTLRYRVRRMMQWTDAVSREEFLTRIRSTGLTKLRASVSATGKPHAE